MFDNIFSRLDETDINDIIGNSSIKVIRLLKTNNTSLANFKDVLLQIYSRQELLLNKEFRDKFIDVLSSEEANQLISYLTKENTYKDVYEQLKKINYNNRKNKEILLSYLGIPLNDSIDDKKEILNVEKIEVKHGLFKHQREAIDELNSFINKNNKNRVLLHMPTGSGKTRTAIQVICNTFRKSEPTIIIWLAHSEELCQQAYEEFSTAWNYSGNRTLTVYNFWGGRPIDLNPAQNNDFFLIGSLNSMYNYINREQTKFISLAAKVKLVVMDEAHQAIAPTYKLLLDLLLSFKSSLIGLSATPGRTWNEPEQDEKLSNFFYRNKVTLKIEGYTNPVDYLVKEGYLADVIYEQLLYDPGFDLTPRDLNYLEEHLDFSDKVLKKLSEDEKRNLKILYKIQDLVTKHKRIIFFGAMVDHSNNIAFLLQSMGIEASSITGSTPKFSRQRSIEKFKSHTEDPIVLCNFGVLTTGFDAPSTSCAVIARPTLSLVLYSQMVGRAIRGTRAGGNESARVVTVVDKNLPGFKSVAEAFTNWEDIWK